MSQIELLKKRRFLPIFLCQFLGAFNDNVFKNALLILITYRLADKTTLSAPMMVSFAAGIFILPFFLFSALAGELADKYNKTRMIRLTKFAEIVVMFLAVMGIYMENISLMMAALFFAGTQATFFGPLKYGILPQHLEKNELVTANGFVEAATFIAILLGTIIGGITILGWHGKEVIALILFGVAISGVVTSFYILPAPAISPNLELNFNIFSSTKDQIKYSRSNPMVFASIIGISWFWLIGAMFLANLPTFAKDILKSSEGVVTLLFSLFSIGTAIGSVICSKILKGEITAKYTPLAAVGISIFILDLYLVSKNYSPIVPANAVYLSLDDFLSRLHSWRLIFDFLGLAIMGGIYIVPLYAILQAKGEDSHRSRIIASNNIMNSLFMVFSSLITGGMLALNFRIDQIFLFIAILNIFVAAYLCQLLPDKLIKSMFQWVLRPLFRVEVKGIENFHAAGDKVVIIPNHLSFLDAPLLSTFLPGEVTFAINSHIAKRWWIRPTLRLVKTFSLDSTSPLATKKLIDEVKNKGARLIIFPEGRITITGALMKVYEGPGMIADRSGAKILPVRLDGPEYSYISRITKKVKPRLFPKVTITILPPQSFEVPAEVKGRARRKLIGAKLHDVMVKMMFDSSNIDQTLFESLCKAKEINGRKLPVLMDMERKEINYGRLLTGSFVLGKKIAEVTNKGEFVGLMLPSSAGAVVTFFAMQAYGRVPAMMNFATGIANLLHAVKIAKINKIYTSRRFVELAKLSEQVAKLAEAAEVIYLEDLRKEIKPLEKICGLLKSYFPSHFYRHSGESRNPDPALHWDDKEIFNQPAAILFTSGSEGKPKGVALSHRNIQANRYQAAAMIDFGPSDSVFNAMPLFHSFGLTVGTLLPVLSGIKTFLYPSPLHYRMIPELVYDTNATIMFGTDTFLSGYARFGHPYDFHHLRYAFAGAEKLKPETRQLWFEKFGVRILEGYGATETAPIISMNTAISNKLGTVGKIVPGMKAALDKVEGIEEGGRLELFGPNVMLGYLKEEKPGEIVPPSTNRGPGWYDTGDIVTIDEQGYLTIKGRAKRFAKVAGEMISLLLVEEAVGRKWPKLHHVVVAVPDLKKGEQLILLTESEDITREALSKALREEGLAEIFIPKKIQVLKNIPTLATGKVDYPAVAKLVVIDKED